jgi:hypothetical protein
LKETECLVNCPPATKVVTAATGEDTHMPDPPRHPDAETGHDTSRGGPPGVPRWVKVSGIVVAILVLALVAVMLIGGDHGPGRHG